MIVSDLVRGTEEVVALITMMLVLFMLCLISVPFGVTGSSGGRAGPICSSLPALEKILTQVCMWMLHRKHLLNVLNEWMRHVV